MKSRLVVVTTAILLAFCGLISCGGGPKHAPNVAFSANSLTFGDEAVGSTSEPLLITLSNTGTAPLAITSIAVSANFAETNNCGTTLAPGANCAINVTLAPDTTGSLTGTVTITDNAADSPQTVSLSGTAVTPSTLTGYCVGAYSTEGGQGGFTCHISEAGPGGACPIGQPAVTPAPAEVCSDENNYILDSSTDCYVPYLPRNSHGHCQATSSAVSCSVQGQACGAAGSSPCCSGFACMAGTGGSFCQPAAGGSDSRARSSLGQTLADRLR